MKKDRIIVVAVMIVLMIVQSCGKKDEKSTQTDKQADKHAEVSPVSEAEEKANSFSFSVGVRTMRFESISRRMMLDGSIQSVATAAITPDTGGILRSIVVSEGARVRRGSVIAYVDPSKPGQQFLRSPVRASISGVVSSLPTKLGNQVSPKTVIAHISDDSTLELRLAIPEVYAPDVQVGIKGTLTLLAFPDEAFPMTVASAGAVLSTKTHTMNAVLAFDNRPAKIKSGMYGSVELILETKPNVIVLRRDYVVLRYIEGKTVYGVFVVNEDDSRVGFVPVTLGIEDGHTYEITSGVAPGDVVVIVGQSALSDGNKVFVYEKDGEIVQSATATKGGE